MMENYIIDEGKFIITTDTTDWYEELVKEEPDIETVDAAIDYMLKQRKHPAQMGRMALIAELIGKTEEEIVGMPKPLLQTAVASAFQGRIHRRKASVKTANGKPINIREIIAPVAEVDEDGNEIESDETHVMYNDPRAVEYALKYLHSRVPGYIRGRLNIVAANGGDVEGAAEVLKIIIDEMVEQLK
jgi:hypothetical protein